MDPRFSTRVTKVRGKSKDHLADTLLLFFSVLIRGKSCSSLVYLFRGSVYFSPEVFQEEFLSSAMCVGAFARAMAATWNHD